MKNGLLAKKKSRPLQIVLIFLLLALLVGAVWFLGEDLRALDGRLPPRRAWRVYTLFRTHGSSTSTAPSVADIQSWMTFDYLNKVFHLPKTYLQTELNVQNSRYPDVSIRGYARETGIDSATAIDRVRAAILKEIAGQQS